MRDSDQRVRLGWVACGFAVRGSVHGLGFGLGYHSMGFRHFLIFRNFVRSSILSRSATRIYHVCK